MAADLPFILSLKARLIKCPPKIFVVVGKLIFLVRSEQHQRFIQAEEKKFQTSVPNSLKSLFLSAF